VRRTISPLTQPASVSPLHSRSQWPWSFQTTHPHSSSSTQQSRPQMQVQQTIRQWNFSAFEWTVRNVRALRDYVEGSTLTLNTVSEDVPSIHEVLKDSPDMAEGKFKVEIVVALSNEAKPTPAETGGLNNPEKSRLLLCITSLMIDLVQEYNVTMLAAVRVEDDRGGEHGARADWHWNYWEDWRFRQDSEVWECSLPSLSSLLENPRIAETDSFVICVQIHNPVGPQYPQHPFAYYVPKDLLDGVEASLDNPHTGDVKFVCVERMPPSSSNPSSPMIASSHSRRSASEASYSFTMDAKARKRTIYAHSDILIRRSEYFNAMFSSSFSETVHAGDRKAYEILVEEADFLTIYWLLKYCYANWVLFKEQDDPRNAVEHIGEGWSVKWLNSTGSSEWDWKPFNKLGLHDDHDATTSVEEEGSVPSSAAATSSAVESQPQQPGNSTSLCVSTPPGPSRASSRLTNTSRSTTMKRPPHSPTTPKLSSPVPPSRTPAVYTYPLSPRQTRAQPDPHPHPTPQPPPASAFSIWVAAHRYAMPGLSALAMNHMMNTIQPSTAFPLLLATTRWDELHTLVEDYIISHWDLACASEEFDRCCQEVAAGEWGPEGGRTFAALFRRLRSR